LARFSGVSGTGPLVVILTFALAGWPADVAAGAEGAALELGAAGSVVAAGAPALGAAAAPVLGALVAPLGAASELDGLAEDVGGAASVLGEPVLGGELEELGWARAAPATSKVAAPVRARSFSCMAPRTPGCANHQKRPTRH